MLPKKFLHRYDKGTFCRTHLPQLRIVPLPDPDANINAHHGLSTKTRSPLLWRQRTNPGLDALQVFMFRDLRRQKSMPPTWGRNWRRWDCIPRRQRMMHYLSLSAHHVIKQALRDTLAMVKSEPNVSLTVQVSGRCLCGKPCHFGKGLPHMSPIALHRRPTKKAARRCLLQALVTNAKQARIPEHPTWHIPNSDVPPRNSCIVQALPGEGRSHRKKVSPGCPLSWKNCDCNMQGTNFLAALHTSCI